MSDLVGGQIGLLPDRTGEYLGRDLGAEGIWPASSKARYGGVLFNSRKQVLLRQPANHFDGYVWTLPKGTLESGESTAQATLREVLEETGVRPMIVGHLAHGFSGTSTGWVAYFYLMVDLTGRVDQRAVEANGETTSVRWASLEEAKTLISKTINRGGRGRDLAVVDQAFSGLDELFGAV